MGFQGQVYTPRQMIERLIAFDTTSRNSNLALIDWVGDYLKGWGARIELVPDPSGQKANMIATLGPEGDGGVVLSGHTDVVPIDGQDWHSDPWVVTEKDGRLYGRGTSDMKSFIAIGLAMVPEFLKAGLNVPLHFALSYDEEVGCTGVPSLVKRLHGMGVRPAVTIVGEPSEMQVVNAHKGGHLITTTIRGLEGHSSAPDKGVNAVMIAADLIHYLNNVAEDFRKGPLNERFDPPHSTMQTNIIQGGTGGNIIAGHCSFFSEMRMIPGEDDRAVVAAYKRHIEQNVLPRMHAVSKDTWIKVETMARIPALKPEAQSFAESLCLGMTGRNSVEAVAYGTEAGSFQELGISTVVCGPGNIAQAHAANEFIAIEQVEQCVAFMRKLSGRMATAL